MPWRPIQSTAFAICVYPFKATQADDLPLQIGDQIYVIEQGGSNGEWYRGYLVAFPSLLAGLTADRGEQLDARVFSGIFPRNCVEIRELVEGDKLNQGAGAVAAAGAAGGNGETDGEEGNMREKRKSQAFNASRLSRAMSGKRNTREADRKSRQSLAVQDPVPRLPNQPRPLAPVPLLRVGDDTALSGEEPLVDEIASCLREWHDARLHEVVLARGYGQLERLQELIKRLDTNRKQLMHDVMTIKELNTLREDTVWDLVAGNKLLSEEVIVRNPKEKGRILTANDSVIEMTKLQANMSTLDRAPKAPTDIHMLYHVLVDIRSLIYDHEQPATLQFHLCLKEAGEKPRPVSENYSVALPLHDASGQGAEEQSKSLFVNLSATDIGIGAESNSLFVVFKLLKEEPVKQNLTTHHLPRVVEAVASPQLPQKFGSVRGRRSVFSKKSTNSMTPSERPSTVVSERSSTSTAEPSPTLHEGKSIKRTIAFGAVDIGTLTREQSQLEKRVTMWKPATPGDAPPEQGDEWVDVVRDLMRSPTGQFSRISIIKRLDCFVTAFASSDLSAMIRNKPTLLHDVFMTPKLGFTGVPAEKRSDIYLTLTEPVLTKASHLAHSKYGSVPISERAHSNLANLQLTLEVRKATGERVDDCIFTSSNHSGHTAWRTTGVELGETWNQTIRLSVPAHEVPGSHIVMSIADSPNFPFALAWVPLWEAEAFVRDGEHHVQLYVYDEYSSSIIGGRGAYLALPPWVNRNDPANANTATVSLRTFLSSTEHSQDPNLLGLLKWRDFYGAKLVALLERFPFVPEVEIVKLLPDVFASLFEILHEYANSETYEDLVFYNFVIVLSIARDRRFNLDNVIDTCARTRRHWPHASQCLMRAYQRLLTKPLDADSSRKLRATLKVGDQLLRLIIETTKESVDDDDSDSETETEVKPRRHPNFLKDLNKLFVAVMALMRNPMPILLGTQTIIVQHFHSWLPELRGLMTPFEVLEIAIDLLDACAHAQGKLVLYRLVLLVNYSQLDIFKAAGTRATLISSTFRWLNPYWGDVETVTEQWRNQVRLCCSVVATQMQELGDDSAQYVSKLVDSYAALQNIPRKPKKTFSMLFPTTFPFPSKPAPFGTDADEIMLEISALLASALTVNHKLVFDTSNVDINDVLVRSMQVNQSILSCKAFPSSWLSLHVSHHLFGMRALERIYEVLVDTLPDISSEDEEAFDFNTEIWRTFFDTLFLTVSSPALAMETFPEQKRRAIWKIAGDVREHGAGLLRRSWEAIGWETEEDTQALHGFKRLGGYQFQFSPDLVAPIVELCLSVHASLRAVATEVLRSMIVSAWQFDQDLGLIQTAMIDCLDRLCRTKPITESYLQKTFIDEMLVQFKPLKHTVEDSLYNAVVEMFTKIEDLLGLLVNVHQAGAINESTRIMDTLRLMEFLKGVRSDDAYVRHVHKLTELQSTAGNHTEAGLALQLHADRYEWDPSGVLPAMTEPNMAAQSAFERKENLYFEMCQHFERGKSWRRALAAYRELATQYEENSFDFSKLARCQHAMASVYEKIAKGDRIIPRYFRVTYRGLGFPPNIRDKDFIFEGQPTDRLATFEDRLQQSYPSAQFLRPGEEPNMEGQYLQVYPVSPNKDLEHTVYQRTKVTAAAREHALMSNPQKFTTTTRMPAADLPITEQPVQKVVYTTAEPFPTILRRSEIVQSESFKLTPVEAAVERTTRKTQELLGHEKRISSGEDEGAMSRLSEDLLLAVDPESESSVARYRNLLPVADHTTDEETDDMDPDVVGAVQTPPLTSMQNALRVALLDHALAIRRCLGLYNRSAYLATRAEIVPRFEDAFDHELQILFPNNAGLVDAPAPIESEPESEHEHEHPTISGAHPDDELTDREDRGRASRGHNRSLSFLRRRSSSRQRSDSRAREPSLTRRFTFLRSNEEKAAAARAASQQGGVGSPNLGVQGQQPDRPDTQMTNYSSMSTSQLKKRLSFLKGGSRTNLSQQE